jgi:hypothetical protein
MSGGDSSYWNDLFKQSLVPMVLLHVITTWEQMPKPGQSDLEDTISDKLFSALVNAKNRSDLPFLMRREDLEFDFESAKETGRKDIVFFPSFQEEIYLCLEAKRLNAVISGKVRSLADEYVKEGMIRFVERKYSRSVRHGVMLGYVLDGDIERAIKNIEKNIRNHLSELRMSSNTGFIASSIRPSDCYAKDTQHQREHEKTIFNIHHLFVAGKGND